MGSTMDLVSHILGIDRVNMNGKVLVINEKHGCSANFLLSSIIFNALKKDHGICFMLFHNTFSHYHNVGMKLGYNLTALKEKGKVAVVEVMETLTSDMECIDKTSMDSSNLILAKSKSDTNMDIIYNLFVILKEKYYEAKQNNESVIIVIDDLSHLCDFGFGLRDVMSYVRYLRSLVESEYTSQLCILIHTYEDEVQNCNPNMLSNSMRHMAHVFITVEPLETGYSSDASGKMIINWRIDSIRREYHWPEKITHLYKLMDRQVKVYAPGAATILQ